MKRGGDNFTSFSDKLVAVETRDPSQQKQQGTAHMWDLDKVKSYGIGSYGEIKEEGKNEGEEEETKVYAHLQ